MADDVMDRVVQAVQGACRREVELAEVCLKEGRTDIAQRDSCKRLAEFLSSDDALVNETRVAALMGVALRALHESVDVATVAMGVSLEIAESETQP